jgi:hypothetical protein
MHNGFSRNEPTVKLMMGYTARMMQRIARFQYLKQPYQILGTRIVLIIALPLSA